MDEHARRGPSHPDVISLDDVPVIPSLSESTVRHSSLFILLILLTFLSSSLFVALLATTIPARRALPLANLSSGALAVPTVSTAARRAVLSPNRTTLSWIRFLA